MNLMSGSLVYLVFALSLVAVIKGGDWLVDAAAWFAKVLRVPQVIVGATIISIGTTLPETLISGFAAYSGKGDIITGTAIGSVLCNTGIILGLNVLVNPANIRENDTFFKIGSMIGVLALFTVLALNGVISRFDSYILIITLGLYMATNIWSGITQNSHEKVTFTKNELRRNVGWFVLGLVLVVLGARLLLESGVIIANRLGVPEVVIAVTLFAIGSSLPELITSISASLKGHSGLFIGNILGANTLNIILVIAASSAIRPFAVHPNVLSIDLPVAFLLMGVLVLPAFFTKRIGRLQGLVGFLIYGGYIVYIINQG